MTDTKITARETVEIQRPGMRTTVTLDEFDSGSAYLLTFNSTSTHHWQIHLDRDGVEQLLDLFVKFERRPFDAILADEGE